MSDAQIHRYLVGFNQEPTWPGCSDNYENKFEHRIIGTIIAKPAVAGWLQFGP